MSLESKKRRILKQIDEYYTRHTKEVFSDDDAKKALLGNMNAQKLQSKKEALAEYELIREGLITTVTQAESEAELEFNWHEQFAGVTGGVDLKEKQLTDMLDELGVSKAFYNSIGRKK